MIGTLIITHGGLAREFLAAAREIAGELDQFEAISLEWSDGFEEAAAKVTPALARLDTGEGVLILADTFGGTPCNVAMRFAKPGRIEVVSGVNLPMVMRLACAGSRGSGGDLGEIAHWLQDKGRKSICIGSDLAADKRAANGRPGEPAAADEVEATTRAERE
jgi:PTS system mannose-specific IIA component